MGSIVYSGNGHPSVLYVASASLLPLKGVMPYACNRPGVRGSLPRPASWVGRCARLYLRLTTFRPRCAGAFNVTCLPRCYSGYANEDGDARVKVSGFEFRVCGLEFRVSDFAFVLAVWL